VIRPTTVIIDKLNDGVGVVPRHVVLSEHGVQVGTEHALLRGPSVEDVLLPTLTTWWRNRQVVQDQL
jgi:hypothetical protein